MITDNEIRQQGYAYFLAETPELLQTIEQDLFTLLENYSIAKVHNLMRATHTIKGGAATVGLDTIKTIAHSLEDIFKALYSPDVVINSELQTMLLEAYECLELAVTTELTASNINSEELIQRATTVFAQIQTTLGDAFGAESHIPTSEELGFDIVQSIFEVGVKQRLESISEALLNSLSNEELVEVLHSQLDVFLGLAESLNLPGLKELACTIMSALEANPHKASQIAEIALADLQESHKAVLAGDRTSGGSPSLALQTLIKVTEDNSPSIPTITSSSLAIVPKVESSITHANQSFATAFFNITTKFYQFLITSGDKNNEPLRPANAKFYLKAIRYIFGWFNHYREIPETELSLKLLIFPDGQENSQHYIETWLNEFLDFIVDKRDQPNLRVYRQGVILIILLAIAQFQYLVNKDDDAISVISTLRKQIRKLGKEYKNYPPVTEQEKKWLDSPKLQELLVIKEISNPVAVPNDFNLLEEIWGGETIVDSEIVEQNVSTHTVEDIKNDNYLGSVTSSVVSDQVFTNISESILEVIHDEPVINNKEIADQSLPTKNNNSRQPSFVRVNVDGLQHLNYLAGELLIYQKRRTLYDDQIIELIDRLTQKLSQHQAILNQLRDLSLQGNNVSIETMQKVSAVQFDALEMDIYTEFNLTLHEALEDTLQLQETAESLDLLMKQSGQISDKKYNLTLNIIDNLVEARMLPLGTILNRFPQMVQKLGNVYAKLVELKLIGTQVLIDKAIAEKLYDPLLQLVRNAFDHGIETPEIRRGLGKTETGLIEICAYHQGSQTIIEIRDDGHGINLEKIRERAIALNLIPDDHHGQGYVHNLTESELIEFMFSPGFSTAGKVSEISGRGMGLDIVRTQLQALNGLVSVQSSPSQGTTFILKIPFSMTTDKLMLVQAGGVVYALLLDSIEKILIPAEQQIKKFEGKQILHWHSGEDELLVNLLKLSNLMYYNGSFIGGTYLNKIPSHADTESMKTPVLLLRHNQGILGLEVDQIIGEQELVIRPLGNAIAPPKYIYGCSSLANGNLVLVIDGTLLVDSQQMQATLDVRTLPSSSISSQQTLLTSEDEIQSTPLLAASAPLNTIKPQLPSSVGVANKLPKVVLVIDDAISVRQTISLTLQKFGYQVLSAQNGVEALEQLEVHPEIEVIISDLEMPRMNGFELLSHIRQNPDLAKKPVVILTSRSSEKHRQLAQELGATAYFTKPYLEHEFLSTVDTLANRNKDDSNQ
ncbi:hybrid sensor histidine kinase/response regulator [Anabaena cylindrica FACHB-243]|uniref:histidine kinase n=1 Tax=Anabaena cylindrica (strain ATCC 27899 / PCC 7122) TaxID=272123 RepID=K9ZJS4_ANACC|nr:MULTISPECIES: hybrid sensor histidine kinase/response regulator [Anabaena]AFZ58585.1 CheA signal transduction histidine kinase [Anabaena cylindrica PCC 7122]MBD2416347.1 hybrid sensor histidine kinase/response regulator [Anabaena cylindrica FACHB-243]MBY5283883.1 hybrid sensor histidine kinase/response regulator [Anabaena sp. CCAP 1446/1C]MBY5310639.1 hybrid sensor histidine kinase/response regulator [Anabaena sp. CCAP 1446/1C]MCM2407273.1 hybrid sensor histidine kinase/response regulator [